MKPSSYQLNCKTTLLYKYKTTENTTNMHTYKKLETLQLRMKNISCKQSRIQNFNKNAMVLLLHSHKKITTSLALTPITDSQLKWKPKL